MYHTPNFRGLKKRFVPQRFNEGWGLQHIKLYGADDEVILSGANLSRDYFTNRQDRYHAFKSKDITAYYALLHEKLRSISYRLTDAPDTPERFRLEWPPSNVPPEMNNADSRAVQNRTSRPKNTEPTQQTSSHPSYVQQTPLPHPQKQQPSSTPSPN
jgi:CDP-diacylglycerol---glycerol-3-phosphate 3-phosphatidyltransferase